MGRGARRHGARQGRRAADAEQQRPHGRLRQIFHRPAGNQRLSDDGRVPARRSHDHGEPGPDGRRHASGGKQRRHAARRQDLADDAELRVVPLHRGLRSGTRGHCARALCGRHDRACRHLPDVVRHGRSSAEGPLLQHTLRRRLRSRRPRQGDQEPGGARTRAPRRRDAGRRHAGSLRRRRAGHARSRHCGYRAVP